MGKGKKRFGGLFRSISPNGNGRKRGVDQKDEGEKMEEMVYGRRTNNQKANFNSQPQLGPQNRRKK